jgi:hypothetical protein
VEYTYFDRVHVTEKAACQRYRTLIITRAQIKEVTEANKPEGRSCV